MTGGPMPKHGHHLFPVIGGFACAHSESSLWKCWTVFWGVEWNAHTSCGVGLVWIPTDVRAVKHANHLPAIFKQPAECAHRCCNRPPTNHLYLAPDTNPTLTPPIGGGCGAVAWVRACLTAVSSTCWCHFLNPATLSCWVSSDNVTQAHRAAAVQLTVRLPQCIVGRLTVFIKDVCLSAGTQRVLFSVWESQHSQRDTDCTFYLTWNLHLDRGKKVCSCWVSGIKPSTFQLHRCAVEEFPALTVVIKHSV